MKKLTNRPGRLLAALLTLVLALSMFATTALAAETVAGPSDVKFDKYLVMDENANVPNATFTFTVTAGEALDANVTNKTPKVLAGIGTPTVGTAVFAPVDTTFDTAQTGDTVTLGANQKYAVKEVTVDFSSVTYNEPGIYRYVVTEVATTIDGVTNDTADTRILDVYVDSNAATADLTIAGTVLHPDASIIDGGTGTPAAAYPNKNAGFTNTYATKDLTISNTVTGNQGYRQKYFEFTVAITGAAEGTKYTVDLADATSTAIDNHTNSAELTVAAGGTVTATYMLKHDQSIVIKGVTADTKYTVTEVIAATEGYTTTYAINGATAVEALATGEQTMGEAASTVAFTNHRAGTVPTGILLEVAPYVLIVALATCALVIFLVSRKRNRAR